MSNNSWQRRAPILALLMATGAVAVVAWLQPDDSLPVDAEFLATQGLPSHSPPVPEPAAATSRVEPAVRQDQIDQDQLTHNLGPVSDQDLRAQLLGDLGVLEREFLSEPISAAWSGKTEKLIADSLSETSLAANEAPLPVSHDAECRSSSCRIRVTYRNEMDAQMGEIFLLGGIANQLPSAQFGRLIEPDGSVQIVMYANTGVAKTHR